jgi:hypothetical protein
VRQHRRASRRPLLERPTPLYTGSAHPQILHERSTTRRRYIPRMVYARLESATLKDVTDDYYYGCSCQSCLHTARLSLCKLRTHLGPDFPLIKIRERLNAKSVPAAKSPSPF